MSLIYGLGSVLMLHRVSAACSGGGFSPNEGMTVTEYFLEKFISEARLSGYQFVSLDKFHLEVNAGKSSGKFLVLTFDDGYRDNLTVAYPLLKRLGIPFTVYVTTSFPDGDAILWWYAIERLLQDEDSIALADGSVISCCTIQEKLDAFISLRELIMALPRDGLGDRVSETFAQTYFDWRQMCEAEALSWDEIYELAQDPLVTIGAHTMTHPVLSSLTPEQVCAEMHGSRKRIEARIGTPVNHFCYPFGSRNEVGAREFELARRLGFKTATTTRWGNVFPAHRAHLQGLPRVPLTNAFNWDDFRRQSFRRFWRGRVVSA